MSNKAVVVSCDGVKLKLTCSPALLEKAFSACVVNPFLGAFNKKRGTSWTPQQLKQVQVDGAEISDLSLSGAAVLGGADEPCVTLTLPGTTPKSAEAAAHTVSGAVSALLALEYEPEETWRDAFRALRLATREAPATVGANLSEKIVALVVQHAGLASDGHKWNSVTGEACAVLNNLLVAASAAAGPLVLAKVLGVAPRLAKVLAEPERTPLPRLKLLSPIAFHLSLQPALREHEKEFGDAIRTALEWVSSALEGVVGAEPIDEAIGSDLASDLVRTLFNMLRASAPDALSPDGQADAARVMGLVAGILRATGSSAQLKAAKLAALQLVVALPEELAFPPLSGEWHTLIDLLQPLLAAKEAAGAGPEHANAPVLPLLVLHKIAEADESAREALKRHIFGEVLEMEADDPYKPLGADPDFNPNHAMPPDAPLRLLLVKQLTDLGPMINPLVGKLLWSVCAEDSKEFTRLCGLGSAAAVLQEKGALAQMQQELDAK
jgi:hypothetical protein